LFNKKCLFYHVAQSSARSFSYRHNWRWLLYITYITNCLPCKSIIYSTNLTQTILSLA
jgi:hypothetical protein